MNTDGKTVCCQRFESSVKFALVLFVGFAIGPTESSGK